MSVILNFNLPHVANMIQQIICLYDPEPPFQSEQNSDYTFSIANAQQLIRDTNVASAGFVSSLDFGNNPPPVPSQANVPLPANSYTFNLPSLVYGTNPLFDNYSVLQINTALARIEPGFSRIRIDYQWIDSGNGINQDTEYYDCPFYEGWNVTARELNNVVNYVEGGIGFVQQELDTMNAQISYALSHELWRGTSVSGQVSAPPITDGLMTGPIARNQFAHSLPDDVLCPDGSCFIYTQKDLDAKIFPDGFPPSNGDFNAANWPGEVIQGGQYSATRFDDEKGYVFWAENMSGTVTLWFYDQNWNDSGVYGCNFSVQFFGPIDVDCNGTGGALSFWGSNFGGSAGTAPISTSGNGCSDPNGIYFLNANNAFTQCGFGVQGSSSTGGLPILQTFTNGSVSIGGVQWYRVKMHPKGGKGSHVSIHNINHFTLFTSGQHGNFNDGPGGSLILNGPQDQQPTITNVNPNPACVGQKVTLTGTNFSGNFGVYINNTNYPVSNLQYQGATQATFNVPSGVPTGSDNVLMESFDHSVSTTAPITIVAQPTLATYNTLVYVDTNFTISGTGFAASGLAVFLIDQSNNVYNCPVVTHTNNTIIATVAHNIPVSDPPTICTLKVVTNCGSVLGTQNVSVFPSLVATLVINPSIGAVPADETQQFVAQIQYSDDTQKDVSDLSSWLIFMGPPGSQTESSTGNSTYGTISAQSNEGFHFELYTAPNAAPPGQDQEDGIYVVALQATFNDPRTSQTYIAQAIVYVAVDAVFYITPPTAITIAPTPIQFAAELLEGEDTTDVSESALWFANGVENGNALYGTVVDGLYTPPALAPPTNPVVITASYIFASNTYTASASATVDEIPTNTTVITVNSQLNIYLGDGRFGYVPTNTQTQAWLNQYYFVQFAEQLTYGSRIPDPNYQPVQQLTPLVKDALDPDIANVMFNLGDAVSNPDGTTNTLRTVVLGFIDPSDGLLHSIWDINNPLPAPGGDDSHSLPLSLMAANQIKAFDGPSNFKGSIVEYINDLTNGAQNQLDNLNNRANVLLTGNCSYDNYSNTFIIQDELRILGVSGIKAYGILGIIPNQSIIVKPNQYLYIDSKYTLNVGNFSDVFDASADTKTIIVGAVLDKFYTTWPLLQGLDADTSGVQTLGENSWMRVGPLLVQWGQTSELTLKQKEAQVTDDINFPIEFVESCTVLPTSIDTNGAYPIVQVENYTKLGFKARIVNSQNVPIKIKVSWMAIGM